MIIWVNSWFNTKTKMKPQAYLKLYDHYLRWCTSTKCIANMHESNGNLSMYPRLVGAIMMLWRSIPNASVCPCVNWTWWAIITMNWWWYGPCVLYPSTCGLLCHQHSSTVTPRHVVDAPRLWLSFRWGLRVGSPYVLLSNDRLVRCSSSHVDTERKKHAHLFLNWCFLSTFL